MSDEFRITFAIERRAADESDFTEIGFGCTGPWSDVEQAAHMLESAVQHREWETSGDMPDPTEVDPGGGS